MLFIFILLSYSDYVYISYIGHQMAEFLKQFQIKARLYMNVEDLLIEYRKVIDEKEILAQQEKILNQRKHDLEFHLMAFAKSQGLESFEDDSIRVHISEALRIRYEPELWSEIVKWAVDSGNDYIIQRRLNDTKILELIENGTPIPEGLAVDPYTKISHRRKD